MATPKPHLVSSLRAAVGAAAQKLRSEYTCPTNNYVLDGDQPYGDTVFVDGTPVSPVSRAEMQVLQGDWPAHVGAMKVLEDLKSKYVHVGGKMRIAKIRRRTLKDPKGPVWSHVQLGVGRDKKSFYAPDVATALQAGKRRWGPRARVKVL